jgi:peptidoglycan/xylan/chitin deacetylase (PgdA/CDA1 family)
MPWSKKPFSLLAKLERECVRRTPGKIVESRLPHGIASISFDDIPHSAARVGGPILEAAGARGTFYVCGAHLDGRFEDRAQFSAQDLQALHARGHEIACHTFAHPNVTFLSDAERMADHEQNARFVRGMLGDVEMTSFAYPYGFNTWSSMDFYKQHFETARGVYDGVNVGRMDFAQLLAIGLQRRDYDRGRIRERIAKARDHKGWIIFFTHDVDPDPTAFGCTPDQLNDTLADLSAAGLPVLTVKEAAAQVRGG